MAPRSPASKERRRRSRPASKKPVRVSIGVIEAFCEQHGASYATDRHRPRAGAVTLVQALMAHFDLSRATVMRHLQTAARRQAERLARLAAPMTPEAAGYLVALRQQYQNRSNPGGSVSDNGMVTVSNKITPTHSLANSQLTPFLSGARDLRLPSEHEVIESVVLYLKQASPEVQRQCRIALGMGDGQASSVTLRGRGLDAIGLNTTTVVECAAPMAAYDARAGLLEALDAYESEHPVPESWGRVFKWLRQALAASPSNAH